MLTGKKDLLGKEPIPMPYRTPKIQHKLTWDQTCDSAVAVRRLNLWNITRHLYPLSTQIGYICVLWRKWISYPVKPVRHWTEPSGGVTLTNSYRTRLARGLSIWTLNLSEGNRRDCQATHTAAVFCRSTYTTSVNQMIDSLMRYDECLQIKPVTVLILQMCFEFY